MAKGDRPDSEGPPRSSKRRRRPPVLELKATEVGGGEEKASEPPKPDKDAKQSGEWQAQLSALDWRGLASRPWVTGAVGAIAGAVLVAVVMSLINRGTNTDEARVSEIAGQLSTLSARIETLANRPVPVAAVPSSLGERIDRLTAAISETEQRLAAIENRPAPQAPDLSAVNQRTATIESTLKELRGALADLRRMAEQSPPAASPAAVETLTGRIGSLEGRIAALATPRPTPTTTSLAGEIRALNDLADAIRSGRPFLKELEVARARLGDRSAPLASLEPFAAKGLPTVPVLAERFTALVPEMLRGPEPEGGVFSRLFINASRLVEVRPVGEPVGNSLGAVVARMETKLGRGDLEGALAEVELLPAPAKETAASWIAAATQRRNADRAVQELIDAALSNSSERKAS